MVRPRARRSTVPLSSIADAYSIGARAWAEGPTRLYRRLAELLVEFSPHSLANRSVLDLGSGTGEGSRAAVAVGADVTATDLAPEMLRVRQRHRPPAVAGDALALPFRDRAFDVVLAPFSLNHLDDPSVGVREAARVGHRLLASTYADDDDHPVKEAVERALTEEGWARPSWYLQIKASMKRWGTVAAATAAIERGGLLATRVERFEVPFDDLGPSDMVAWRFGLAQCAPFVAALDADACRRTTARAIELLGHNPPLVVRRVIFVAAEGC